MDGDLSNSPEAREANELVESTVSSLANYSVTTSAQYLQGGNDLKRIKGAQARLEALRTAITKPLNAALKAANDLFRQPAARLDDAERTIKRELTRYSNEQDQLRRQEQARADEAARKERDRLDAIARKAAESGKVEKAETFEQRAAAVVAPIIQREAPKVAGITMRKAYPFEIVDANLIPREYLMVDEKKIRGVVNALKLDTKIPGVRVREEDLIAAGAA